VPHISLVFREMWDTTIPDVRLCRLSLGEPLTFSIFSCFLHIQPARFQAPDKTVILSEALCRSIANGGLYGAESKDPGDACWQMLLGAFRPQTTTEDKKSHRLRAYPDFLLHRSHQRPLMWFSRKRTTRS
jgi:hypothetical protein